jgi:hypothetical protein
MCDQCPLDPPEIPDSSGALASLDTALLIARVQAKCSLMEARGWWQRVGRYAMTMRLAIALDPWVRADEAHLMTLCQAVLTQRFLLDLTPEEAAEVCAAMLEGWSQRVVLTSAR